MISQLPSIEEYWQDIFEGIAADAVPFDYLDSVSIDFKNKKTWEINIPKNMNTDEIHDIIHETLYNYKNSINNIHFNIDLLKVKTDVTKLTQQFLTQFGL
jgi:hypothetical protein